MDRKIVNYPRLSIIQVNCLCKIATVYLQSGKNNMQVSQVLVKFT